MANKCAGLGLKMNIWIDEQVFLCDSVKEMPVFMPSDMFLDVPSISMINNFSFMTTHKALS